MHANLLHNGQLHSTAAKLISPGQVGYMNGWGIFSTIRVCEGVLFAFERHYTRMKQDATRMHVPFPYSPNELKANLKILIEANNARNATLRVAVVRNRGGNFEGEKIERECDLIAFTANLNNWGEGVRLSYVPNARLGSSPHAGAKITSWIENLVWNESAKAKGFDEAILLNEKGEVSECTSANIFAVFGKRIVTPPLATSGCLPGVTRALLLEEIAVDGFAFQEDSFTPAQLESSDFSFVTSTTRDLLPILEIEESPMRHNHVAMTVLQEAFTALRNRYVAETLKTLSIKTEALAYD